MYCGDLCPVRDAKDSTGDPNEEKLVIFNQGRASIGSPIYAELLWCC